MPDSSEFDYNAIASPSRITSERPFDPTPDDFAVDAPDFESGLKSDAGSTPPPTSSVHPQESGASIIWETLQTLVLAGLLIIFFRTFIFQNFVVEGSSMFPTLVQGERLIVSRLGYYLGEPQRGDVIVFQYPHGPERDFVKRIIGLPGETISLQDGRVFVNDKPLPPEDYVQNKSHDNRAPITLGEDEYFVMGDNRTGSSDSRSWGPLQRHFIIGKAWLIYYPFEQFHVLEHPDLEPIQ